MRIIEGGERLRDVKMLLDTGSGITLLPRASLNALGIDPSGIKEYELVGFDGHITKSKIFHLQVIFIGKRFTENFCAIDDAVGIIGRDILNRIPILYDGPNLEWSEVQSPQ